ncbi:hypothetical protein B0W47_00625 [Komagataeibacter nataicola]|uniref:Uncharacterized protein n=1 Tax=Komagataeibacter nataicola TaxID=265960 RepID=A0A9N7CWL9_9PROT|nr:hypothetical protein B0W47_00625 [Komagataeibacter nataicola]PYD65340.1 hypothetical protein CDI09_14130 [Komagataeibacter nataicola]GBR23070.1 hypothetical protein AA0616_2435 [Komagataeibacter nataicola NRIC 0616]
MPENREEKGTNADSAVVLSGMESPSEIWPHRCGADYVANLAPPIDWNAAAARCRARFERDMAMRASRLRQEGGVNFSEGD